MQELLSAIDAADLEGIRRAIGRGADVRALNGPKYYVGGLPAVHAAVLHEEMLALLLAAGLAPDTLDNMGRSALSRAARSKLIGACQLLLAAGADPNLRGGDHGTTALIHAAGGKSDGSLECVGLLLAAGADPTIRATNGRCVEAITPQMRALLASYGWPASSSARTRQYRFHVGGVRAQVDELLMTKYGLALAVEDEGDGGRLLYVYLRQSEAKEVQEALAPLRPAGSQYPRMVRID